MNLYTGGQLPVLDRAVVAMGMFDGCHNGHKRVLRAARRMAARKGCPFVVWTYSAHPLKLLHPKSAPLLLQDKGDRIRSMAAEGVDILCLNTFDRTMAETPAEEFIRYLHTRFQVEGVVLGRSHTFGARAQGNPSLMRYLGGQLGFAVEMVETMTLDGEAVHSSAIRAHLQSGQMRRAAAMLGRGYAFSGRIQQGQQMGRKLGFPTINMRIPKDRLIPKFGVYAAHADIDGKAYPCILNLGVKPTVGGGDTLLEAHLLRYSGDLYGEPVHVRLFQFLRPERKFPSVDALKEQIAKDTQEVERIFFGTDG